jgi:hypothetical protein
MPAETEDTLLSGLTPADLDLPDKFEAFRPAQLEAIDYAATSDKRFVAMGLPTGAGKSLIAAAIQKLTGLKAVYLTATKGLQDQVGRDFGAADVRGRANYDCHHTPEGHTCDSASDICEFAGRSDCRCPYTKAVEEGKAANLTVTNYTYWLHSRRLNPNALGNDWNPVELLILDECFPAGTIIDGQPIENIKKWDKVTAFDQQRGRFVKKSVTRKFWRAVQKVVKLTFSDQSSIVCTPEHPFFTNLGWLPASKLFDSSVLCLKRYVKPKRTTGDTSNYYAVCDLRKAFNYYESKNEVQLPAIGESVLQSDLRVEVGKESSDVSEKSSDAQEQDAREKPNAKHGSARKDEIDVESDGVETSGAGGEWTRSHDTSTASRVYPRLADGSYSPNGTTEDRLPDTLQIGYWERDPKDWNRSRWTQPWPVIPATRRQEEREDPGWVRVVSIEVYESTDRERFEQVCPNGIVYNLEVEGLHTYIANDFVVHNCHEAVDQLTGFLEIKLPVPNRVWEVESGLMPSPVWVQFASGETGRLANLMREIEERNPRYRQDERWKELDEIWDKWVRIAGMDSNWVWELSPAQLRNGGSYNRQRYVTFSPIWPGRYSEALFSGVQKIILLSATLRPYTLRLLGIKESDVDFREWPAVFSPNRGMVYHVPTAKLTWKAKDEDYKKILDRVDEIIGGRLDRKGIIHTVSYDRASKILAGSRYAAHIFSNSNGRGANESVESFRRAKAPAVLVSPSFSTGFDFPGDLCEYQIILKTPYPNTNSRVIKERCESNDYRMYAAAQELVQMCGRARRYEEDRSETIIVDNGVSWLLSPGGGKKFLPGWFRVWTVQKVPNPPPKL